MTTFSRILVGMEFLEDASPNGFYAALQLAKDRQAAFVIAFVIDKHRYASLDHRDPPACRRRKRQAQEKLQAYHHLAKDHGLQDVQTVFTVGQPERKLYRLQKIYHIDVLVMRQSHSFTFERAFFHHKVKTMQRKVDETSSLMMEGTSASRNDTLYHFALHASPGRLFFSLS